MAIKILSKNEIDKKFAEKGKPHIHALNSSVGYKDQIEYTCDIHNCIWSGQLCSVLYKKYSCPECMKDNKTSNKLKNNNLRITRPDIAKLLEDQDSAKYIFQYSKEKHWFICPMCGARLYKSIFNVVQNGLICPSCSDGFSYPNKFMFQVLKMLGIDFVSEYSPSWISPMRYDFYFEICDSKYIIEMDGGLGHGKKVHSKSSKTIEQTAADDLKKDFLANQHNIHIIRIPCDLSDKDYIMQQIEISELRNILDLYKIDIDVCDFEARKNMLFKICAFYNKYPFLSYKEIIKEFHLSESTIHKYLTKGYSLGLCPKYKNAGMKDHVLCLDSQLIFSSAADAAKYYSIEEKRISKCCQKIYSHACSLHFIYLSEYNGNIDELVSDYSISPRKMSDARPVNMYNKTYDYVKTFPSVTIAAQENKTTLRCIIKSCNSKHKYNYGKTYYYADDPNQPDKTKIIAA